MKNQYHPAFVLAYHLNVLPDEQRLLIPSSTQFEWKNRTWNTYTGADWYQGNLPLFSSFEELCKSRNLQRTVQFLIKIIVLKRLFFKYASEIKIRNKASDFFYSKIKSLSKEIGLVRLLRILNLSYDYYRSLKEKTTCSISILNLCVTKHPSQLLKSEVMLIKESCFAEEYKHWPLISIFHELRNKGKLFISEKTFYRYIRILNLKRFIPANRRKNHDTGIRATKPLELIHIDVSKMTLNNGLKAWVYMIQDNFSRKILSYAVDVVCSAKLCLENLRKISFEGLIQNESTITLMTDDGSENFGDFGKFIKTSNHPIFKHIVAQKDVSFSNSMIESCFKQLKYNYWYRYDFDTIETFKKAVELSVNDFNHRPHDVLHGRSPNDVFTNPKHPKPNFTLQLQTAKQNRITENKRTICCKW